MYKLAIIASVFLIGLYFTCKYGGPEGFEGFEGISNIRDRCPDVLIQKGSKYYIHNSKNEIIYLGKSIPFYNLFYLNSQIKNITWITYFMIDKTKEEKDEFIFSVGKLLEHTKNKCIIVGNIWEEYRKKNTNEQIVFKSKLEELVSVNEVKLSVI